MKKLLISCLCLGALFMAASCDDDKAEVAKKYQVSGLPTLMIFKDGEPVERLVGLMPKSSIITNIEKHI